MGMLILISNADGIYSPGIAALAKAAAHFGEVRIVAPDVEESAMGHAITHSRPPLRYRRTPIAGFQYQGNETPADCVALSAHHWERVDLVFSGINLGLNLGTDGKSSLPKTRRSVRFPGSPSCCCTKRKKAQIPGLSCTITVS